MQILGVVYEMWWDGLNTVASLIVFFVPIALLAWLVDFVVHVVRVRRTRPRVTPQ